MTFSYAETQRLRWKRMGKHAFPVPVQAIEGSAGYDLYWAGAAVDTCYGSLVSRKDSAGFYLFTDTVAIFPCGWAVEIPDGYVGLIRERSGLGKIGISVHGGVVDHGYTGEVKVLLSGPICNDGRLLVVPGQAIAQLVVVPCLLLDSVEVENLGETVRGDRGFGSTDERLI